MSRPDYIARLHEAKYDLRFCSSEEKPEMLRRYRAALEAASLASGISPPLREAAAARDLCAWVKQERRPKPPRPQ